MRTAWLMLIAAPAFLFPAAGCKPAPPSSVEQSTTPAGPGSEQPDSPSEPTDSPSRETPKPTFELKPWEVGQRVLYRLHQEAPERPDISGTMEFSLVGAEMVDEKPYLWEEIHTELGDGTVVVKMLVAAPREDEFREDPARFFFGVSDKSPPLKVWMIGPGMKAPTEVSPSVSASAGVGGGIGSTPPLDQWHVDDTPSTILVRAGSFRCRRLYLRRGEVVGASKLEAWHSADVPVTGLVKLRSSLPTGEHTTMDLEESAGSGAVSHLTIPASSEDDAP